MRITGLFYISQGSGGMHDYGRLVLAAVLVLLALLMYLAVVRDAGDADPADVSGPYDGTIRTISRISPPRPVRMTFKAKILALLTFPGPLALFAIVANDEQHRPTPGITIGGLLIFFGLLEFMLVGSIWLRPFIGHKRLISEGDLATGQVIRILATRGYPYLVYEFEAPNGARIRKMDMTCTNDLSPGMKVPVFYDRENPKKAVALCTSFYDIALPGKQ